MTELAQPHHQALIADTAASATRAGVHSAQAALTPSFPRRAWNKTKEVVSRGKDAVNRGARAVVSGSKQVYTKAKNFVTRRTPPPVPKHS